ncbi:integrase [Burkholderia arboris]|uniref:integrase n=1 Tax=Burkholderia arboris TaxID=488730 RepID=UPI001CF37B93|nr:integrase [Burkholderia arboris]MCA8038046.1 integrase [Burkholderia arboris]
MTLSLLDLRPLKEIDATDKAHMPVSYTSLPDGTSLPLSRYKDTVWDFSPYIPQENKNQSRKQIDWHIGMPDGCPLTHPKYEKLLEATKDYIWSLFSDPVEGRKRPGFLTLCTKIENITPLLRWMVSRGITRFSDMKGHTLDYVAQARKNISGGAISSRQSFARLLILEDLYRQRGKLHDALQEHPWPHETSHSLSGTQLREYAKPKTLVIADAIAKRIAELAIDYVRNRSIKILAASEATQAARLEMTLADKGWCYQAMASSDAARAAGYSGATDLRTARTRLRTACYIVIDMFSGIRDSEMMSLEERCIVPGKSHDGSTDILWLHGTIYKTGVRSKRWLVPAVVAEAVEVLSKLTAPLRDRIANEEHEIMQSIAIAHTTTKVQLAKRLDTVRRQKKKLFLSTGGDKGDTVSVLSGKTIGQNLKDFCKEHSIHGDDGQPYALHPHQFRRSYAKYIARAELGDLLYLRDHFGHWSIDMTTYYADGGSDEYEVDVELMGMIADEKRSRQTEIVTGLIDSDTPLANGGHWLSDWRSSVRTAANKEELIREYADTITLNGTGHSWCVGNAKGNGCGGLCVFEAQMCVDCSFGVISQEHRPVWEGIKDQQNEALALDDMGPGGRARAKQILGYAEKVLRRLDGQEVGE